MMRRIEERKTEQGYIALLAVLIVGAASLAAAVTLLTTGTDSQRSTLVAQQSAQARQLAYSCAEEALQLMHDTTSFTGNGSLTLGAGACTYAITNTGGSNRTVVAVGTVGNVVRKQTVYATINSTNISVSSWQEVGN